MYVRTSSVVVKSACKWLCSFPSSSSYYSSFSDRLINLIVVVVVVECDEKNEDLKRTRNKNEIVAFIRSLSYYYYFRGEGFKYFLLASYYLFNLFSSFRYSAFVTYIFDEE